MNIKQLLMASVILTATAHLSAELKYNQAKNRFYSSGASKKVNQKEYHALVVRFIQIANEVDKSNSLECMQLEIGMRALLKVVGTPAALRLSNDLDSLTKQIRKDLSQAYEIKL